MDKNLADAFIQELLNKKRLGKEKLKLVLNELFKRGNLDQEDIKYNESKFPFTNKEFAAAFEHLVDGKKPSNATNDNEVWIFDHRGHIFTAEIIMGQGSSYILSMGSRYSKLPVIKLK